MNDFCLKQGSCLKTPAAHLQLRVSRLTAIFLPLTVDGYLVKIWSKK